MYSIIEKLNGNCNICILYIFCIIIKYIIINKGGKGGLKNLPLQKCIISTLYNMNKFINLFIIVLWISYLFTVNWSQIDIVSIASLVLLSIAAGISFLRLIKKR